MVRIAIVAIAVYAGWFYLQRSTQQDHVAERRALDERAVALMARAISPGSALSCLVMSSPARRWRSRAKGRCSPVPEAVASAVSTTSPRSSRCSPTASAYARRFEPAYAAELVPLRTALELDRFGIVAHVLAGRDGCSVEKVRFADPDRLTRAMCSPTCAAAPFEEQVTANIRRSGTRRTRASRRRSGGRAAARVALRLLHRRTAGASTGSGAAVGGAAI